MMYVSIPSSSFYIIETSSPPKPLILTSQSILSRYISAQRLNSNYSSLYSRPYTMNSSFSYQLISIKFLLLPGSIFTMIISMCAWKPHSPTLSQVTSPSLAVLRDPVMLTFPLELYRLQPSSASLFH